MDISFLAPGYFIALFIQMSGTFNGYFILYSRIFHCTKNSQKIWTKMKKKIGMVYRMSVTAFRVHCIYPKKKISLHPWPKSRRSQDKNDDTCQGPCNGLLGGWSHDQFPKMVKMKVVALHCSFQNQLELCSKVLLLLRYEVKDFQKHHVFFFFFFCIFLNENNTKSHNFTTFWKLKEGATIVVPWKITKKRSYIP